MLNKEEFISLYKKFQNGQCTPDEIVLLNNYQDDMRLLDEEWHSTEDKQVVHDRILQKLNQSREASVPKTKNNVWLKVAAVLVLALTAGIWALTRQSNTHQNAQLSFNKPAKQPVIVPGGNKAVLTIADGTEIALTDAKNGQLATQAGIKISKAKDGMLVYNFTNASNVNTTDGAINTVTTPRGGQYQVVLADGTRVWLNAASSLRFPVAFNGTSRSVELTGEGYFEVSHDKSKPFIVKANGTNIEVLGTHFDISAYSDDKTVTTTLLEGSVRLVKENVAVLLKPGQQGVSINGGANINVKAADLEQVMAWKNGFFQFRNTYIKDIMKQAARWYDVEIDYQDNLQNKEYGGKISRYSDISELLRNLELTGTIHFKVEGRRITVMQ